MHNFRKLIFFMDVSANHISSSNSQSVAVLGRWSLAALILANQASSEYIDVLHILGLMTHHRINQTSKLHRRSPRYGLRNAQYA